LPEVKAVIERRAADAADHAIHRLDARAALVQPAGAFHVVVQLVVERDVDLARLVGSGIALVFCLLDKIPGIFEHMHQAGAGPRPEPDINGIDISQ
jgi:hypothetical protein